MPVIMASLTIRLLILVLVIVNVVQSAAMMVTNPWSGAVLRRLVNTWTGLEDDRLDGDGDEVMEDFEEAWGSNVWQS